jgi:hypothetical protein
MSDYTEMSAEQFQESDHRLAGAEPVAQPDADHDPETDPHRLAGAKPADPNS